MLELLSLFGPEMAAGAAGAENPLYGLLGQYANPATARKKGLSAMFTAIGKEFLNPPRYKQGSLADIGRAINSGVEAYNGAEPAYLSQAVAQKQIGDELSDTDKKRKDIASWITSLPEEDQLYAQAFPEEAAKMYMTEAKAKLPGSVHGPRYGTNPYKMQDEKGNYFYRSFANDGTTKLIPENEGVSPVGQLKMVETVAGRVGVDPYTGQPQGVIPGTSPEELARLKKQGSETGEQIATIRAKAPGVINDGEFTLRHIDQILNDPDLDTKVGWKSYAGYVRGTPQYEMSQRVDQLKGEALKTAIENFRGMGALSNQEGQAAVAASNRIQVGLREKEFKQAVGDFRRYVQLAVERARYAMETGDTRVLNENLKINGPQKPAELSDEEWNTLSDDEKAGF